MSYDLVQEGQFLFHITHAENLASILADGLHAKNLCGKHGISPRSIAFENIQNRRAQTPVVHGNKGTIHDYVPLFFGARPPMLYAVNKDGTPQDSIVYLLVDWKVLDLPSTVFTDGNASTGKTKQYCGCSPQGIVDLQAARAPQWGGAGNEEVRRKKAAEVLVWQSVPLGLIRALAVKSEVVKSEFQTKLKIDRPIYVALGWYYP